MTSQSGSPGVPNVPSFQDTNSDSLVAEVAFALMAFRDGRWHPSGTAVAIANGLLITAKHVVADYFEQFEPNARLVGSIETSIRIVARQVVGGAPLYWNAYRLWLSPSTDVAFICVAPASESSSRHGRWRIPPFQVVPPIVGSRIVAFGYRSSTASPREREHAVEVEWKDQGTTSVGEVVAVFQEKRDGFLLPFPSFQTTAKFVGGMSGGPVFNEAFEVCGLICSSIHQESESEHCSFSALIWPSLATLVHIDTLGRLSEAPTTVLELVRAGVFQVRGFELLEMTSDADETTITLLLP